MTTRGNFVRKFSRGKLVHKSCQSDNLATSSWTCPGDRRVHEMATTSGKPLRPRPEGRDHLGGEDIGPERVRENPFHVRLLLSWSIVAGGDASPVAGGGRTLWEGNPFGVSCPRSSVVPLIRSAGTTASAFGTRDGRMSFGVVGSQVTG